MFRKLVSSLPFSPALVGQLGFYARRLSKEQASRRLGLIFTVLALVVQSLALLSPPESTYAASPTNECKFSNTITQNDPSCQPCPYNETIWINDSSCNKNLQLSIEAINLSRSGKSAVGGTINASDRIQYTIRTTNTAGAPTSATVEVLIADLVEYANMTDAGGGVYDQATQKISWGNVLLAGKQTDTRSFVVTMKEQLPVTPQAVDDPHSYDCMLSITYGNTLNNAVGCSVGKELEGAIKQLPETGPGENIAFATVALMVVTYFYVRSRQLNREMKIIRRDFNAG
ncbi:MAG TPA: hypothetical protein VJM46_00050 [Candidatus Saccharimonadales bacterium]|nr:hypothetical protein [Candidatus Saccharimonadales bacterium]